LDNVQAYDEGTIDQPVHGLFHGGDLEIEAYNTVALGTVDGFPAYVRIAEM